jgi:gliding motility-associated lipoprotein GldH
MVIMNRSALLSLLLPALLSCASCDSTRVYEEYHKIGNATWNVNDKAVFTVVLLDTASRYNFFINVRNQPDYPYCNLFLFLRTVFPGGKTTQDTIECTLARPDGKWLGTGMGSVRFNRFLFQNGLAFREPGTYKFELVQAMRVEDLKGITDIGIRIDTE